MGTVLHRRAYPSASGSGRLVEYMNPQTQPTIELFVMSEREEEHTTRFPPLPHPPKLPRGVFCVERQAGKRMLCYPPFNCLPISHNMYCIQLDPSHKPHYDNVLGKLSVGLCFVTFNSPAARPQLSTGWGVSASGMNRHSVITSHHGNPGK